MTILPSFTLYQPHNTYAQHTLVIFYLRHRRDFPSAPSTTTLTSAIVTFGRSHHLRSASSFSRSSGFPSSTASVIFFLPLSPAFFYCTPVCVVHFCSSRYIFVPLLCVCDLMGVCLRFLGFSFAVSHQDKIIR